MSTKKPTYKELKKKLAKTEALLTKIQKTGSSVKTKRHTALLDTKEYLEAYKASEQNFKNLIDASPLGVRIVTADGDLIYANQAILDICGYKTPQEFAAVPRSKLYTSESYQAHQERKKKRKLKEYVPSEYEISIQRPNGEVRNLQVFRREVMWGGEQQFMALHQDITEHKRAEEALRESEERFHTIVENSNDGIVFIKNGIVQYCNPKLLEMGSYIEADTLNKPFISFVTPESREKVQDIYRKRMAGKKTPDKYELDLLAKDGRTVNTEISASLVNVKQELVDIAIVRDITGRKKAEETLANEATRRRILVEQSRDGIVILEEDGAVYEINQRFADMLGYTMEEVQKLHVFDWEYQYPKEQVVEMIRTVDEKGDHFETKHRRKDGTTYDVEISTNGATFGGQKLIFCVCRDITERKQAEDVDKRQRELLNYQASLIDNVSDAIVSSDNDYRIISWNKAAEQMYGWREDEVIGKNVLELLKPIYLNANMDEIQGSMDKTGYWKGESIQTCKDGTKLNVLDSISMRKDEQGKNIGAVTIFRDITERKIIENALIESEERFSKAFYASPDAISISRISDGVFLEVNDSHVQDTGYTREEIIGKSAETLNMFQNNKQRDKVDQATKSHKRMYNEEFQFRNKSGELRTKLISSEYMYLKGEPCVLVVSTDITERKQAEEALKESEERLKEAQTLGKIGSWEFDVEKQIITWSEETYALYERDPKDGPPSTEEEAHYYSPEQTKILRDYMARAVKTKQTFSYDFEIMLPSQRKAYYHSVMKPVQDTQGKVFKLSGTVQDITERKQMEQSIRESEERFSTAFNSSPEMMVIVNINENRYIEVNDSFARNLGYSREELIGHTVNEFNLWVYPEENEKMTRLLEEQGKLRDEEFRFRAKNGEIHAWFCSADTINIGGVRCMLATSTDITERRKAQEALRESEEKFSKAFVASPAIVAITNLKDGKFIEVNDSYLQTTGYSREEVTGKSATSLNNWANPQDRVRMLRIFKEEGKVSKEEFAFRMKSGEIRTWLFSAEPITFGGEECLVGVAVDITERKQAEEALKESQEMFSLAFHYSPTLKAITNVKDGRFIEVNDNYCRALGYSREELIGHSTLELNLWYDIEQRGAILETVKKKGVVTNVDVKIRVKTGDIRLMSMSIAKITLKNEQCLITIAEDITERKRMEEALEREHQDIKLIMDTSRALIWYKDINGRFLRVNRAFAEALDMTEKDFIGKTVFDLYSADIAQSMTIDDREVLVSASPKLNIVEQYESAAGLRWVQTDKVPVLDNNGKPIAVIGFAQDITVQEIARQALRESEDKYRSIVEQTVVGIGLNKLNEIIFANKALLRMFNYDNLEEFLSIPLIDHVAPSSRDFITERIKKQAAGEKVSPEFEYNIMCKGGTTKTMLASTTHVSMGGEDYTHTIFQDITESKQAAAAIKESEERFRTLFETMVQGVIYHDNEGRVISANPAAQRILGLTLDEMVGKTSLDPQRKRLHEDGSEFSSEDHPSIVALRTGKPVNNVIMAVYNPVEKVNRWILNNAIPEFRRGEKKPYRVYTTFTDITGRKQGEQRINYLNQTLRSIRNINQLITREKDRDKLLKGVCDTLVESRSFYMAWIALLDDSRRLITYAHSGMPGDFSPMVEAIKQGNLPPCVEKALKKNQVIVIEDPASCVGCTMSYKSLNYGSISIRLEYAGNIYGVLCTSLSKDILADKNEVSLFQEIANDISFALYNMDLQFDHERLEQERLRSAKLESIGTLAGGIAHDFNNLLTGIMGNIGMVKTKTNPTEATYEMLEEAEKAALRARDLTQQLLTFAKGGKPIKKSVQIAEIIKESATFALTGSKAKLEISLPDDLYPIEADEGQISQVINNLTINADEAMPEGGTLKIQVENVTLKSAAVQLLPAGNYVRIDIADMGMGISAEHLERIFEPYFTTKQRGSGLGLTSAYSIVRNHGGIILADSILNKGSTFHVYLPATKKPLVKGGKKMITETAGQAGGKILVMDDEEIIRKMLKNMLSLAGYAVELSSNGDEALEKYQQARKAGDPFSAVIMDLTIPGGMGGKETMQKLLEVDPSVTAIVSSGYATDPIMSDYKAYGFKAVIAKPYSSKQLQETLSGLLTRKGNRG
jgi:PAS domain S-box-containing protein